MAGNASEVQIAGFLVALRTKGETVEELAGLARTMRAMAAHVDVSSDDLLDTAGTGGGRRTFNVSTTAALIAAGAGCTVAKHGNRSATGLSGSADVLEALGARIDLAPDAVARCIDEVGFGFMFAPAHHQATRYVIPVRRQLAVRTIFNFLGPLTNPAGATRQLIGVSDAGLPRDDGGGARAARHQARAARRERGRPRRAQHLGADAGRRGGRRRAAAATRSRPRKWGSSAAPAEAIPGGDPAQNAQTARAIFAGERGSARATSRRSTPAPRSTPAAAPSTLEEGVRAAERAIDDGAARRRARAVRRARRASSRREPARPDPRRHARGSRSGGARRCRRRRSSGRAARGDAVRCSRRARPPGLSVIAEHKRRSPSAGPIRGRPRRSRTWSGRTSEAAPRRCRSSPRARASTARSMICARRGRRPACRSCARTSSSTATRCSSRSRPAPTRSC